MSSSEFAFLAGNSRRRFCCDERREHRQRLIERRDILLGQFLEGGEGAGGKRVRAEHAARGFAHRLLLAGKAVDREFEVARKDRLHAVAVETDQLAQERGRQQRLALDSLLLEDDLGQHRAGDVLVGLGVVDDEILSAFHHLREIGQGHVGARRGIVEPAVGVFFDRGRSGIGHEIYGSQNHAGPFGSTQDKRFFAARETFFCAATRVTPPTRARRPAMPI